MNYYERHLGDYARDTVHLSLLEHGVYTLLLDRYYVTERPLPLDERELFRLLRASSKAEKAAVGQVLREFFVETPDGWRHGRCDEEIERVLGKSKKARDSANARWSGKQTQSKPDADAMRTHTERISERNANASGAHDERNALQSPDSRLQTPDPVDTSPPDPCVSADSARETTHTHTRNSLAEAEHRAGFLAVQRAYPPFAGRQDWLSAEHYCRNLVEQHGESWQSLTAGVERYAAFVAAGGVSESRYVLTPAKFFSAADRPWTQPWAPPQNTVPFRRRRSAEELEAEELARAQT